MSNVQFPTDPTDPTTLTHSPPDPTHRQLTHKRQRILSLFPTTDRFHANDQIKSCLSELPDCLCIDRFGCDEADQLEIAGCGMEGEEGMKKDEDPGEVGRGGEEGDECLSGHLLQRAERG